MTERLPNLIIAGLGKAGTTSLFWYLSQHPDICGSQVKEVQYFTAAEGGGPLPPLEGYAQHFRHCGGERYVMEASPQYFHGGQPVIGAIKATLPDPRIIVSLRDPIDRLWSQFRFVKTRLGPVPESMTFDEYVDRSARVWEAREPLTPENRPYWHLSGGFYLDRLREWNDAFGESFRVVFFEALATDPMGVTADLCGWLGIDDVPAASLSYSVENRTEQFRSRTLQRLALALNKEGLLGSRRRLKAPLRKLYYAVNRRPPTERMSEPARRRLRELYGPANEALAEELRRQGYREMPAWLAGSATRSGG